MASTYVYRDATSDVAVQKATISFWVKKCGQGTSQYCFFCGLTGDYSSYSFYFKYHTDDTIKIVGASGGSTLDYKTTAVYRDPAAWYHHVIKLDMTETGTDRVKLYTNGVFETNYSTQTAMTGTEFYTGKTGYRQFIGYAPSEDTYSSVVMSNYQYIDGLALAPTEFGETDSTSGIWKVKTACYGTPGTNGFCLKMQDRTNLDLDSSSNALTMTTSGTLTATYDNPSNNFATMNIVDNYWAAGTFVEGNCKVTTGSSQQTFNTGTLGLSAGKWYFEAKITQLPTSSNSFIGISAVVSDAAANYMGEDAYAWGILGQTGNVYNSADGGSAYGSALSLNDVVGWYLDLDNNKLYQAINGTVENSGTGISITAVASTSSGFYFPAIGDYNNASSAIWECNFGNGYFGTTAVTSAVADEGGIGAFEYDPSAGTFDSSSKDFRAICTKNINLYGG